MPQTRSAIIAAARSEALRGVARRAVNDRAGLLRDLRNPGNAGHVVRRAAEHPATRELASIGLMFLPGRFLPLGWVASLAVRRILRRSADPRGDVRGASASAAAQPLKNVTPKGR